MSEITITAPEREHDRIAQIIEQSGLRDDAVVIVPPSEGDA